MCPLTAILCAILALIVFFFLKKIITKAINFLELLKIPGPPNSNFIFGNCGELATTQENLFKKLREYSRKYYPIYHLRIFHKNGIVLQHPDDIELVLSNSKHIQKSLIYNLLHWWLGTGLLTSTGEKWMTRRKILTPAFHFNILQQFVPIFNDETERLVDTLKDSCHQSFIHINDYISEFTLKTIAETAMGIKLKFHTNKEKTYKRAIIEIAEIFMYRLLFKPIFVIDFFNYFSPKYLKERRTVKILHNFTRDVIEEREKSLKIEVDGVYKRRKRLAMLDLLLTVKNENGIIDNEGIREEVDTFMFEGHDTTAAALGFALMLIACHSDVQDLIVEEIQSVLGELDKKPTYSHLQEMKYLERALKEALRIYPSVHFISRQLGETLVTSSGYTLPKNTIVHLQIYDVHHNPDIYPDPEKFDPDRFLPENTKDRHPFAYVPFSAGARNCIGQRFAMLELKAAICGILANFVLEPVDTPSTIVLSLDLVLRTKEGIKVKCVPRVQ